MLWIRIDPAFEERGGKFDMLRIVTRALAIVLSCLASLAAAQEFPARPVLLVAPAAPGTPADIVARIMQPVIGQLLGQPVVVENRTGAGSLIGYEYVAKRPPDGYTLASVSVVQLASFPPTVKELRFDPLKDLVPVIGLVEGRLFLCATTKVPWNGMKEMITYSKANPGRLNYGSSAPNTVLLSEALYRELGVNAVHIPYPTGGGVIQGLVAGDIQLGFIGESAVIPLKGRLQVLATTGEGRSPLFPDTPTFAELGIPNVPGLGYSLNAPAGTPKEIITKLHDAAARALDMPEVKARFAQHQLVIVKSTPEAAAKDLADQGALFSDVATKIGFKAQ
jgi:tripartite-type tricarboxylate transporter receptor subunit TctC